MKRDSSSSKQDPERRGGVAALMASGAQPADAGHTSRNAVLAGAIVMLVTLFVPRPVGESLERLSFDLAFTVAPRSDLTNVVIVEMDEKSHQELGQTYGVWSRQLHAQLTERLTADEARSVVFDILFADPGDLRDTKDLAAAFRHNGRVIIGAGQSRRIRAGAVVDEADRPVDLLASAAAGIGSVGLLVDSDLGVRRIHLGGSNIRGLAWEAAHQTGWLPNDQPDLDATRWFRFYRPSNVFDRVSYSDALQLPVGYFRGRVVFIGSRPTTPRFGDQIDVFRTPWNRWGGRSTTGVELQATAFLNLTRGDWLRRSMFPVELSALLLVGFVWGFGLRLAAPRVALGFSGLGGVLIVFAGVALPWVTRLWFPWMIVVVIQIPLALAWSITSALREGSPDAVRLRRSRRESHAPTLPESVVNVDASEASGGSVQHQTAVPEIPDHKLLKRIGAGAYGEVWLAENIIGSLHAVKIVWRDRFQSAAPYDREFRGIQRFMPISRGHSNLVNVLHAGRRDDHGFFFYIMEAADSVVGSASAATFDGYQPRTLAQLLRERVRVPLGESLQIMRALSAAVDYLHRHKLVHRDIKPTNVIFVNQIPKLADIGLVTQAAETGLQVTYLGTQGYIAPEGPGTPAADLYGLGKVLYEMTTGLDRLQFPDLPTFVLDHPDDPRLLRLNQILLKACDNNAHRRYQTVAEFIRDIEELAKQSAARPAS